jgi:hypothetical protein
VTRITQHLHSGSGSVAMLAAMRRASRVSKLAADRRPCTTTYRPRRNREKKSLSDYCEDEH